jgi:hypothetical protein
MIARMRRSLHLVTAAAPRPHAVGHWIYPFAVITLIAGCAEGPLGTSTTGPWSPAADIPTRAELVCGTNGSTTLSTERVQPRPDGVHLRVVNHFDEPVSVEGFDAGPGETDWVLVKGPGTLKLMCWPFSQHMSGEEPVRVSLAIEDPAGLYFDSSIDCPIEAFTTVEWAEKPVDYGPPPLDLARRLIDGLRPEDVLSVGGYPEQDRASVAVIRNGEVVASYGISRFAGEPWRVLVGTACEWTGLKFAGQSVG